MHPDRFEAQVTRLLAEGYEPVTFTGAVRTAGRRRQLAITFDDAFASVAEIARPILDRLGAIATVFAVTDFAATGEPLCWPGIDHWRGTAHEGELRGMDWAGLRALAAGGWEVGSHTLSHPSLTRVPDDELDRQLRESLTACEAAMGAPCTSLAYPYGHTDERVTAAAARAGYEAAASLPGQWHRPAPHRFPRVGVWRTDGDRRFALKTSQTVRTLRMVAEPRMARIRG